MSSHLPNDQRPLPHAGRPRGDAWRSLVAEGIEWEGQVLLGSEDHPLSARLIITSQRLAFARGGEVVLDIARWWLKRAPFLSGNGAINLRIETGSGHRDRLSFQSRDGRPAATDIVTLLTYGKEALPEAPLDPIYTDLPKRNPARRTVEPELHPDESKSTRHQLADDHTYSSSVIDATTLQVLDTTDFPPVTETQSPSTSRINTAEGGRGSSEPITISTLGNQTHRSGEWSLLPIPSMDSRSDKGSKAGWAFRLSGLIALIALAAAFGSHALPDSSRFANRGKVIIAPLTGEDEPTSENVAQLVPTSTEAVVTPDPTHNAEQTAIAIGIGGDTTVSATFTASATATDEPTDTPEPTATETTAPEPTTEPTDEVALDPTIGIASEETATTAPEPTNTEPAPTEIPTDTATIEVPPTETVAPTEAVATDVPPTETAVLEPTVAPTEEPTLAPTTAESPTLEPTASTTITATLEPTASATDAPTATETASPSPTPGFPIQDRTISEDEVPDQVFSTGAFRYTVEFAERGAAIPNLELPAVDAGEWVVIVLNAQNWSDEPATLNMADFQLLVSGDFGYQFVGMDASSPDISRFLGFDPVLEIAELRSIQTGEGLRLALVYLVPPTTTGIELIDDTSGLNIAPSLAIGGDVTALGSAPERPDLIEAVVTEVIDGRTIVVDADGFPATIQYLGIVVPTGDECFATDATQTNSNIVTGQTVYLEREFRNRVTAEGEILARDVWIDNKQGGLVLVAAWMASEGAAVPSPKGEDVRFEGWIQAAADAAEANALGFWATCGVEPVAPETVQSPTNLALQPYDPFLTFSR